jgi:hypothetical protein
VKTWRGVVELKAFFADLKISGRGLPAPEKPPQAKPAPDSDPPNVEIAPSNQTKTATAPLYR